MVDQPGDGGGRHRGRGALVVAHETEGGGVDHLALGLHVSGVDVVGPDAAVTELDGQQRGEPVGRRLGGGVGHAPSTLAHRAGRIGGGGVGGHVDDGSPPHGQHPREHRLDQDERRHRVGRQLGLELGHAPGRRSAPCCPGAVSTALLTRRSTPPHSAATGRRRPRRASWSWRSATSSRHRGPAARTSSPVSSRLPGQRPPPSGVRVVTALAPADRATGDRHVPAGGGQGDCRRPPDAPGPAGHQGPAAGCRTRHRGTRTREAGW